MEWLYLTRAEMSWRLEYASTYILMFFLLMSAPKVLLYCSRAFRASSSFRLASIWNSNSKEN